MDTSGNINAYGKVIGDSTNSLRLQAGGTTSGSSGNSNIFFLNSSGTTTGRFDTVETHSQFGDGSDGALALTASLNMNTTDSAADSDDNGACADGIAYKVDMAVAWGTNSLTLVDTPAGAATCGGSDSAIEADDEVLLINMGGASGDTAGFGDKFDGIGSGVGGGKGELGGGVDVNPAG